MQFVRMKLVIAFALLFSVLAASSSTAAVKFDFFYHVQQWPGSFCDASEGCCFPDTGKPAAEFGMHGLWPNYANHHGLARAMLGEDAFLAAMPMGRQGKWGPEYCDDGNPLQPWEIRDLVASLERNWPTLSCKSSHSFDFWSYEWKKHGTCSNLGLHGYFKLALDLKAAHDLTAILAGAGIVPSDTATYDLGSVSDAIAQGTGLRANLDCNDDADGEAQLFQVYLCVDPKTNNFTDCEYPLPMGSKCTDQVKLPVF